MIDISEIKTRLNNQAESVVKHLLPNAKSEGRELVVGSIFGEEGKSLKVCVSGSKVGIWADFSDDLKGDLIDLWRETRQLTMVDTMSEVKSYLGISKTNFHKQSKVRKWTKPKAQEGTRSVTQNSPVMEYLTKERKLTKETLTAYKISECDQLGPWKGWKKGVDGSDPKPWIGPWIVFPYLSGEELIGIKHLHLKRKNGKNKPSLLLTVDLLFLVGKLLTM